MNILILGAGGPVGRWITRCLSKRSDLTLFGRDDSPYNRHMVECTYDIPLDIATSGEMTGMFNYDLIYPAPSPLITKMAGQSNVLAPPKDIVELCDDKAKVAELLGDMAPKTLWVRDTHGAGGAGAQMASEYLPGANYAVEMLWHQGLLKGQFVKERISYSAKSTSTEVTGTAAVAKCIHHGPAVARAHSALRLIHGTRPIHGIFTVDFKCDENGDPKVTEVNAGKFATSSYPFYHQSWNLPLMAVELALGLEVTPLKEYPVGQTVIRGYDSWPFIGYI